MTPASPSRLRLGTRGSSLALAQARMMAARLRELHPGLEAEEVVIRTRGDELVDSPLHQVGGKGLFVKEIEEALLGGRIDAAVHSLKDLPGELPPGLVLGAVPEREEPWDVLVSRGGESIRNLAPGSRVGTSSLRRRAQLLRYRKDLEVVDLRGNVDTRLRKVAEGQVHAAILAAAGLNRLGLGERATEALAPEVMLPAVAQGALGIETREGDAETLALLAALEHLPTRQAVEAERRAMAVLEGGCKVPMAAFAELRRGRLRLRALVASLDGERLAEAEGEDAPERASALGEEVARRILAAGGRDILSEIERA
ncbi:MAG: hydroxymethylbilane synthase [Candidatus Tectomicrobia bacterium RIFCSPLOWO2_12_FULL_69_37]|nr:MAG: hydroxymethylbilane synthase [Candidatus Tectomicrobia bacterium RIFCSPLOWO2_12_FULL_69_37]